MVNVPLWLLTVTTIFTCPAVWAGVVAEMVVSFVAVKVVAFVPPKVTADAPVKPLPMIVTLVPPVAGPDVGLTLLTVGTYANCVGEFAVPPAVVTETVTAPAACAGAVAVICVALLTVKLVAGVLPKVTAVAPVRFVPVIVTLVPPVVGPDVGLMLVTVGAAT